VADVVEFFLQSEPVESCQRQTKKQADAAVENEERFAESRSTSAALPRTTAGSGTPQWAVIGCPGQTGQTSCAALSQTVKTKSSFGESGFANSSQDLLRKLWVDM